MPGDLNQTCLTSKKWAEKCDSLGPDELVTFFAGLQRNSLGEALLWETQQFPARLSEHRTVMAERLLQAAASGRLSAVQRWMDEVMVRAGICDPQKVEALMRQKNYDVVLGHSSNLSK